MIREFTQSEFIFILSSARWTLLLTVLALVLGGLLGFLVAIARTARLAPLRLLAAGWIGLVQGIPVLILLFLAYYGLSMLGFDLPPIVAASISMAFYASAYLGEIWRGCIQSVPKPQWEAAEGLALSRTQRMVKVILPQAIRIATPPTVGFMVQIIKNTSLASVVGFVELMRSGQIVNNSLFEPFAIYAIIAVTYFAMCYPLSLFSQRLERRMGRGRSNLAPA